MYECSKFYFNGQEAWGKRFFFDVWDSICFHFGTGTGTGEWFEVKDVIEKVSVPSARHDGKTSVLSKTGKYQRIVYTLRVALEHNDEDSPTIERVGNKYRFLPIR